MTKKKHTAENDLLIILKKINHFLQILYQKKLLTVKNYQVNQVNQKIFSLEIQNLCNKKPDILLQTILEHKEIFAQIFDFSLALESDFAQKILNLLLSLGEIEDEGRTGKQKKAEIIKKIFEARSASEYTCLGLATHWDRPEIIIRLVELGANVNASNPRTPYNFLHILFENFMFKNLHPEKISLDLMFKNIITPAKNLIKAGVNINAQTIHGDTILHYLAHREEYFITIHLLTLNAKTTIKNESGDTPLHIAIRFKNFKVAKLLLRYSYPIFENNEGKTPLDIARERNYTEIIEIIENMSPYFKEKAQEVDSPPAKPDEAPLKNEKHLLINNF